MLALGNIAVGATIDFDFNTHKADGTPITLAGTPVVKVYKGDATGSEVTTGVTLTVDHDSTTGKHHVNIVTSDAFYAAGSDYSVVLTAGTVDGTSVAGAVLAHFAIQHREALASVGTGTGQVNVESGIVAADVVSQPGILYVRKTGNDANDGASAATAKLTISAAVLAASSGDVIDIGTGTFTEAVAVNKRITLRGKGTVAVSGTIITQSTTATPTISAELPCVLEHLTIQNTGAYSNFSGWAVSCPAGQPGSVEIYDCLLSSSHGGALLLAGDMRSHVERCRILGAQFGSFIQNGGASFKDCYVYVSGSGVTTGSTIAFDTDTTEVYAEGVIAEASGAPADGETKAFALNTVSGYMVGCIGIAYPSASEGAVGVEANENPNLVIRDSTFSGTTTDVRHGTLVLRGCRYSTVETVPGSPALDTDVATIAAAVAGQACGAVAGSIGKAAADAASDAATAKTQTTAANLRTAVGLATANLDTQLDALPTAAENADAVWDEAVSGHTTTGTYGKLVGNYPYVVTPGAITGASGNPPAPTPLFAVQHRKLQATRAIVDESGDAINLSGKDVSLIAWLVDSPTSAAIVLKSYGTSPALTITGADSNQLVIDAPGSTFTTAGDYRYLVTNETDDVPLHVTPGQLTVEAAPDNPA